MKFRYVGKIYFQFCWTADEKGLLSELGLSPHDNSCVSCRQT